MNKNISKSQEEVWQWKQKAYESVQHLPLSEQIQNIISRTEKIHQIILEKKKLLNKH
jgi:hypothetical protein